MTPDKQPKKALLETSRTPSLLERLRHRLGAAGASDTGPTADQLERDYEAKVSQTYAQLGGRERLVSVYPGDPLGLEVSLGILLPQEPGDMTIFSYLDEHGRAGEVYAAVGGDAVNEDGQPTNTIYRMTTPKPTITSRADASRSLEVNDFSVTIDTLDGVLTRKGSVSTEGIRYSDRLIKLNAIYRFTTPPGTRQDIPAKKQMSEFEARTAFDWYAIVMRAHDQFIGKGKA